MNHSKIIATAVLSAILAWEISAAPPIVKASTPMKHPQYNKAEFLVDTKPNTIYAVPRLTEFSATLDYSPPVSARWLVITQGGWKHSKLWAAASSISISINNGTPLTFFLEERPAEAQALDLGKKYDIKTMTAKVLSCHPRKDPYGGFSEIALAAEKPKNAHFPSQRVIAQEIFMPLDNAPTVRTESMELEIVVDRKLTEPVIVEIPCMNKSVWETTFGKSNGTVLKKTFVPSDFKCITRPKYPLDFVFYSASTIRVVNNPKQPFKVKSFSIKWNNCKTAPFPWEKDPEPEKINEQQFWQGVSTNNSGHFGWRYEPNGLLFNNISFDKLEHDYSVAQLNRAYQFRIPGGDYLERKIVFRKDDDKRTANMINRSGIDNQKEYEANYSISGNHFEVDWTSFRWLKQIKVKDRPKTYRHELRYSILAPGIQVETDSPEFAIWTNSKAGKHGPKLIFTWSTNGIKATGASKSLNTAGMTANWVLFCNTSAPEYPLLLVFKYRPDSIEIQDNQLLIKREKGVGTIAMGMPFGTNAIPLNSATGWIKTPASFPLGPIQSFANLLAAYPWKCKEYFRTVGNQVEIVNKTEYLDWKDDWNTPLKKYTTIPPLVSYSIDKGFLPKDCVSGNTVDFKLATKWGPYRAVRGDTLRYRLPVPDAIDFLPVKIAAGSEAQKTIQQRLQNSATQAHIVTALAFTDRNQVKMPTLYPHWPSFDNFSGAFRAIAYMDKDAQNELFKRASKALDSSLFPQNYRLRIDPLSGAKYVACTSWRSPEYQSNGDNIADIDYWQGLVMYGLYSTAKYGNRWDYMKKNWKLIKPLISYWQSSSSWALFSPGARESGEMFHGDMPTAGYAGLIGFYRLAERVGSDYDKALGAYLMSKAAVPMVVKFSFNDWMKKLRHRDARDSSIGSGFGECWVASHNECSTKYRNMETKDPWWRTGCIGPLGAQAETLDLLVSSDFAGMLTWERQFKKLCPDEGFIKHDSTRVIPHIMLRTYLAPDMYGEAEDLFIKYHKTYLLRDLNAAATFLAWDCPVRLVDWYPTRVRSAVWNGNSADFVLDAQPCETQIKVMVKGSEVQFITGNQQLQFKELRKIGEWRLLSCRLQPKTTQFSVSVK